MKNCQTWTTDVVKKLVAEGILPESANGVVGGAPKIWVMSRYDLRVQTLQIYFSVLMKMVTLPWAIPIEGVAIQVS